MFMDDGSVDSWAESLAMMLSSMDVTNLSISGRVSGVLASGS